MTSSYKVQEHDFTFMQLNTHVKNKQLIGRVYLIQNMARGTAYTEIWKLQSRQLMTNGISPLEKNYMLITTISINLIEHAQLPVNIYINMNWISDKIVTRKFILEFTAYHLLQVGQLQSKYSFFNYYS